MNPTPIGRFTGTPSYEELQREVARLRLTDAEREAIYRASRYISQNDAFEGMAEDADTLDALLERTK